MNRIFATSLLWATLVPSCGARPASVVSALTISATIDGDEPLAGVRVSASGRPLGETDANGHIVTEIGGREGEDISLVAVCPVGYRSPPNPVGVRLSRVRSLGNSAGALLVTMPCRPSKRRLVVVVSAPALPDAPLFVNGTSSERTDSEGVAHVLLLVAPGDVVDVALGNGHALPGLDGAPGIEGVRTQNATAPRLMRSFRASDADEILVLAETAEQTTRARPPRTRSVESRARIERIQ